MSLPFFLRLMIVILPATAVTRSLAQDTDLILKMTTPIEVHFHHSVPNFGSAFYFEKVGATPDPSNPQPQWTPVEEIYLVTAKHVIQPSKLRDLAFIRFYLRAPSVSGTDWLPISIVSASELKKRLHIDAKSDNDVAVVDVKDIVEAKFNKLATTAKQAPADPSLSGQNSLVPIESFYAVTAENFPKTSKVTVNAGDEVIVIGYPRQFFDRYNKLPILKLGLLITPIWAKYDNLDAFLMDFKEYEGLSGALIISKPTNLTVDNGQVLVRKGAKDFVFLGVYAGQRYLRNDGHEEIKADLGLGYYYYCLDDALKSPPQSTVR